MATEGLTLEFVPEPDEPVAVGKVLGDAAAVDGGAGGEPADLPPAPRGPDGGSAPSGLSGGADAGM